MSFTQTITDVINFADIAGKQNAESVRSNLEYYLTTLSDDELIMLETFMYFGRDAEDMHENDIISYREVIDHNKDSAKQQITDLAISGHLTKFLKAGLAKAANLNIDIDTLI
jgi:hypothetical protein